MCRLTLGLYVNNHVVPLANYFCFIIFWLPSTIFALTKSTFIQGYFFPLDSNSIQAFSEKLSELDQMIHMMSLESLGLEKHIDEHIKSVDYIVRVQRYDCPRSDEAEVGLVSHTDKNFVTILYQNEVNGLEIMTRDGQWIKAQSSPNSFIVMVGDSFHVSAHFKLFSLKILSPNHILQYYVPHIMHILQKHYKNISYHIYIYNKAPLTP